jgi:hypothetical protein
LKKHGWVEFVGDGVGGMGFLVGKGLFGLGEPFLAAVYSWAGSTLFYSFCYFGGSADKLNSG